ncbi:MAG: cytochrome c oxidase subunit 3 [Rhodoplanes sp.]|uniref:cytochrome c oxidase subunit 3 n=1 Tax=Rhodoplanes sp. TaxID=1968906 RepID=UPI0017C8DD3E|nr:cytochrome c oxidase subunit 3 [Rhodoplanes sp.]NVO15049.1 cytochrome c oxidase subunit 3 [Rhodoplanes sp.]
MTVERDIETDAAGWGVLDTLPGHPMMWVLILSELVVFGALLVIVAVVRLVHPDDVATVQALLDPRPAFANTLVLITSGWLAARAIAAARVGARASARRLLVGAMALGVAFAAIKLFEYATELAAGLDPETSVFATLYVLITGFHLLHVVLGIVILGVVAPRATVDAIETGTAFWHMVDLVWLLIFPIVYLVR